MSQTDASIAGQHEVDDGMGNGSLSDYRRKSRDLESSPDGSPAAKKQKKSSEGAAAGGESEEDNGPRMSKAREIRLEQNRKAARESRRRKKVLIEELQRSVIFFSRANGTLKQQNEELQRMLIQARSQVQAAESGQVQTLQLNAQRGGEAKGTKQNQSQVIQQNNGAASSNGQSPQTQAPVQNVQEPTQVVNPGLGMVDNNNLMANWMNFQAAAMAGGAGGFMGFDPNNPYAQALNQFAMQQASANPQGQVTPNTAPTQFQFPFGMPNAGMMSMPFSANPFQFQQFATPNVAQWQGNPTNLTPSPGN